MMVITSILVITSVYTSGSVTFFGKEIRGRTKFSYPVQDSLFISPKLQ